MTTGDILVPVLTLAFAGLLYLYGRYIVWQSKRETERLRREQHLHTPAE